MKTYFKIVEDNNGQLKTVHYCINRTRNLLRNQWITAEIKVVADRGHGRQYISGIHVLPTLLDAQIYLKKFKRNVQKYKIVECEVGNVMRKLRSRGPVYLADKIKII